MPLWAGGCGEPRRLRISSTPVRRLEHAGGTDKRLDGRDFCFASHTHDLHICKWNLEPQGYGCATTRRGRNINRCAVSDSDLANEC